MTPGGTIRLRPLDLRPVEVLLCDADGTLFPTEEPAFDASCEVTNRFLAEHGVERRFEADELRRWAMGRNFRSVAQQLVPDVAAEALEAWVVAEREAVVAHLADVLRPDPEVHEPLALLGGRFRTVVVSSSALVRLDTCFRSTGLAARFAPAERFSAEDSLPVPTSKPDPAVYEHAARVLGIDGPAGLAVEDAVAGVAAAVGAGFPTVGILQFVPAAERDRRTADLADAGAAVVVDSWWALAALLQDGAPEGADLAT